MQVLGKLVFSLVSLPLVVDLAFIEIGKSGNAKKTSLVDDREWADWEGL